jgi:hypothetical protein
MLADARAAARAACGASERHPRAARIAPMGIARRRSAFLAPPSLMLARHRALLPPARATHHACPSLPRLVRHWLHASPCRSVSRSSSTPALPCDARSLKPVGRPAGTRIAGAGGTQHRPAPAVMRRFLCVAAAAMQMLQRCVLRRRCERRNTKGERPSCSRAPFASALLRCRCPRVARRMAVGETRRAAARA